jgi:hypothetical protein
MCYRPLMPRDDERERQRHRPAAARPATTFAGNIMMAVAMAMLFDDEDDKTAPESADRDS